MLKKTQVTLNLRLRQLPQHNPAIWVLVSEVVNQV